MSSTLIPILILIEISKASMRHPIDTMICAETDITRSVAISNISSSSSVVLTSRIDSIHPSAISNPNEAPERRPDRRRDDLSHLCESDVSVNPDNWKEVFTDICWWHSVRYPNPDAICLIDDVKNEELRAEQCTLMDLLLSIRHYHPSIGLSTWTSRLQKETIDSIQLLGDTEEMHDTLNRAPVKLIPSLIPSMSSIHRRTPNLLSTPHQRIGVLGLFTIVGLIIVGIGIGLYKDAQTFTNHLKIAFNYTQHLKSVMRIPHTQRQDRFAFFDGLRVISMAWVILGHSVLYWGTFLPFDRASQMVLEMSRNPINYPLFASVFAVDNFFYVSGFLTGYQLRLIFEKFQHPPTHLSSSHYKSCHEGPVAIKSEEIRKTSSTIRTLGSSLSFICQRYIRLMGVTSILIFAYLTMDWKTMTLPAGSRYLQSTNVACVEVIPSLLLASNNLMHGEFVNECFGWTWYLSNDFQFFVIGSFLVIISLSFATLFWFLVGALVVTCISTSFVTAWRYKLSVRIMSLKETWFEIGSYVSGKKYYPMHPVMDYFYVKPWVRIAPHIVGLAVGVIVAQCKIRTSSAKTKKMRSDGYPSCQNSTINSVDGHQMSVNYESNKTDLTTFSYHRFDGPDSKSCPNISHNSFNSSDMTSTPSCHSKCGLLSSCTPNVLSNSPPNDVSKLDRVVPLSSISTMDSPTDTTLSLPSTLLCRSASLVETSSHGSEIDERTKSLDHLDALENRGQSIPVESNALNANPRGALPVDQPNNMLSQIDKSNDELVQQDETNGGQNDVLNSQFDSQYDRTERYDPLPTDRMFEVQYLPNWLQYLIQSYWILFLFTFGVPVILIVCVHVANNCPDIPWSPVVDAALMAITRYASESFNDNV